MLRRLRHRLVFLIFVLLPFHALFVTVGTKVLFGIGHAPDPLLAVWKEGLMALIFIMVMLEIGMREKETILKIVRKRAAWTWAMGRETMVVLLLFVVAVLLFAFNFDTSLEQFLFGFRYLFVPLVFFALLQSVEWEEGFLQTKVFPALILVGGIVAAYGIATLFLPQGFFTALGYSDAHSIYAPGSPLSAFQYISETGIRRIQGTFSGPNQMGVWLLIPWSVGLVSLLQREWKNMQLFLLLLIAIALLLTFSRSAWIAALVIAFVASFLILEGKRRTQVLGGLVGVALVGVIALSSLAPELIKRGISNRHHAERMMNGVMAMFEVPLGHGLGSAGPASNRVSDPCLYFDAGADTSWARDRSDLCLFVGGVQVQPSLSKRQCQCPVLTENWYLQIGYELGLLGFALFLALVMWIIRLLLRRSLLLATDHSSLITLLSFIGISIAALFLHAWEDSAVAYTVWGVVGVALACKSIKSIV